MPLQNMTELDAITLPEVPTLPLDHPAWPFLGSGFKDLLEAHLNLANKARGLAVAYLELFRETEALRAERDILVARLNDHTFISH